MGGGVSKAGNFLLDPARKALENHVGPSLRDGLVVKQEQLGNEASLLGAARLAFRAAEQT